MKTQFEKWLEEANEKCKAEHVKMFGDGDGSLPFEPLTYQKGRKYVKILRGNSAWGFVAMQNDPKKGEEVGDLLKAASWNSPAKHPRGNIFDGTARYSKYGPEYLK